MSVQPVKSLAIVVAGSEHERLRTALIMATAHSALGGTASLFLQGDAIALLRVPISDPDGDRQSKAGLPTLAQLYEEACALGVKFSACQSSLALLEVTAEQFDQRIQWGGMIGFLNMVEPTDRLLAI